MILCLPLSVKRNSKLFRALLHFLILAAVVAPATAQVFKWVDERGVTHYGERPPQGEKASEVPDKLGSPGGVPQRPPPPPPNPDPHASQAKADKPDDSRRKDQCDAQRDLLARLRQNQPTDGRAAPENADAIARQEKLVAEQCKGL